MNSVKEKIEDMANLIESKVKEGELSFKTTDSITTFKLVLNDREVTASSTNGQIEKAEYPEILAETLSGVLVGQL